MISSYPATILSSSFKYGRKPVGEWCGLPLVDIFTGISLNFTNACKEKLFNLFSDNRFMYVSRICLPQFEDSRNRLMAIDQNHYKWTIPLPTLSLKHSILFTFLLVALKIKNMQLMNVLMKCKQDLGYGDFFYHCRFWQHIWHNNCQIVTSRSGKTFFLIVLI